MLIVAVIVLSVFVCAALLQLEGGGTLLASLQALGCSCAIKKQSLPRSVSWMRRAPCAQVIRHMQYFSIYLTLLKVKHECELVKFAVIAINE